MSWKFWKKKETTPDSGENRVDALANRLQDEGRIDELEAALSDFHPGSLEGEEKESWYHLRGIIPFRQDNRALAFERFQEGVGACPDSGTLRFSLGQEYEARGEPAAMLDCFDQAMFPKVSAQYALAAARYAYLWGRTDRGWEYVHALMPTYFEFKILDTNFLYMRGMPFFEQSWAYLAAFSQLEADFGRLTQLTERVRSECHDVDVENLFSELEGFRTGDFTILKDSIRLSLEESKSAGYPTGYQQMRLNVLLTQEVDGYAEALGLLDAVTLTDNDFPWLEDIRTLAKCERAFAAGDTGLEAELRGKFVARQALLFEPDHMINFNLLRYQERLKLTYQESKARS